MIEVEQLIADLNLKSAKIVQNKGQMAIRSRCPHPDHNDSTPSFGLNLEDQKYNCFGCSLGGTGFESLFLKIDMEPPEWVKSLPVFELVKRRKINMRKKKEIEIRESWRPIICQNPEEAKEKLADRGIKRQVVELFDIGYNEYHDILFFPIFNRENKIIAWAERSSKYKSRYKFMPEGADKGNKLYGEWLIDEKEQNNIYLVEGPIDALKIWGWGYKSLAVLGNSVYLPQAERIIDLAAQVIIIPDNDQGGKKFQNLAIKLLKGKIPISIATLPKQINDVGDDDCTLAVFKKAVKNREK